MAKRQKVQRFSIQGWDMRHYRETEAYAQAVQSLYDKATLAITRAAARGKIDPDTPFSFDMYPSVQKEMQRITEQLAERVTVVIETGSKKQWLFACDKNDAFLSSIMDTSKLSKSRLKKMQDRNLDALAAFQGRKVDGMNLSQRVWKYVGQYKDQLENALDVGLGEGRSADELSRDVRQNLRDPNRLFRRVRDKRGNLVLSKRAAAFHPGRGVYRSSYKNAMRLTRSEINMAYRESDWQRWQSLDFVVGFEIHRSNHEPLCECDICEKLVGRYPKTFKFKGWHPQCMCYATPILMDEETFDENELGDLKAALRGTTYKHQQAKNAVSDVPDGFKAWVKDHVEAQKGWASTPYFIKDNFVDGQLANGLIMHQQKKTLLEIAKQRHEQRTQKQIDEIKKRWLERAKANAQNVINMAKAKGFVKLGVDISSLASAIKSNDIDNITSLSNLLQRDIENIKARVLNDAKLVLADTSKFADIDVTYLKKAMSGDDYALISDITKDVQTEMNKIKARIAELGVYIPDVESWRNKFTMDELEATRKGVERTLGGMPSELEARKAKLLFEIDWVEKHKKYSTWEVAKAAYEKELAHVEWKIGAKQITDDVTRALSLADTSKSKPFKELAAEMRTILSTPNFDLAIARIKANELIRKQQEIEARRKKATTPTIGDATHVSNETLDDLKKRLGASLPKTLPYLNKAIAQYESSSKYGRLAKTHKNEIEELMREVFDTHDFGMNIDEDVLEKVLTSWFKNTFEVGGGNGYVGSTKTSGKIEKSHSRLTAAHKLFGLPKSDLDAQQLERQEYEKYGNLLDHNIFNSLKNNTATQYGRVEVRFKKNKVIATWTAGDSLGERWQPSLCSDPKSCSFDDSSNTPTSRHIDVSDLAKFKRNHIARYLELQYHGNLTTDCVESLAFPYDLTSPSRSYEYNIAMKWKNKGVKVYYITSDGNLGQL